jgi:hypothetical protein
MKQVGLISAGVLLLLLGVTPAHGQQEQRDQDDRAPKQEQQAKPERQQQSKPAKQEQQQQGKSQQEQAKSNNHEQQQEAKNQQAQTKSNSQQEKQQAKASLREQQQQAKNRQEQNKSNNRQQEQAKYSQGPQRTQQAENRQRAEPELRLSAQGTGRIPDQRFRSNFGRGHEFRIGSPRIVGGYSRFQYGGYWFGFVQPWPAGWYYTDDVYVDYIGGGYYLCNPYYPDTRVAISVVL